MGGSERDVLEGFDDAVPTEFDGGASFLEGFGMWIVEAPAGCPPVRAYILNDDGVIARIEDVDDGSLAWFGHWIGGTNTGSAITLDDVLGAIIRHFMKATGRMPWRLLAWPSELVEAGR